MPSKAHGGALTKKRFPFSCLKVWWHENGQKKIETTYKDGESVSQRSWPSKGGEDN